MPKISVTAVVVVVLCAAVGYLAFNQEAARDVANWTRRQVGATPQVKDVGSPNYMPVVPGKGL